MILHHTIKLKLLTALVAAFPLAAHASVITFESPGYTAGTNLGVVNGTATNAAFDGVNGWSRSTSTGTGRIVTTTTSGEYVGGQALQADSVTNRTYIGGTKAAGLIEYTGLNTITFDAQFTSGIGVGFLGDGGTLGAFDQVADTGIAFGVGGSPARFEARAAGFGTEIFNDGNTTGTPGEWYHFVVTIGASISGNRLIDMAVRNLTNGVDIDLNGAAAGNVWSTSVTDAQFGVAPEASLGVFVRVTTGASATGATIDNLRFTAVPEPGAALLGSLGLLGLLRRRRN